MRRYLLLLFALCTVRVIAQDLHFTQFNLSPLTLNPALTGNFYGTFRIGGIARTQWSTFTTGYFTGSVYVDAPIIQGFRKQDWVGVGVHLFQDKSGSLGLEYNAAGLGATYHLGLDKEANNVLSIGFQGASAKKQLDPLKVNDLVLPDQLFGGGTGGMDLGKLSQKGKGYQDYTAGIMYQGVINDITDMKVGFAVFHLNTPRQGSIFNNGGERIPMRLTGHATVNTSIMEKILLSPSLVFHKVGPATEIALQALGGWVFNEEKNIIFHFGPGYRFGDALQILTGLDYGSIRAGVGFDMNISQLSPASGSFGALEVGVGYIARIYKKPKADNLLICPRF